MTKGVFTCGLMKECGELARGEYDAVSGDAGQGEGLRVLNEDCGEAGGCP